jgi:hypothetical protein
MRSAFLAFSVLIVGVGLAQTPPKQQEQVPKAILISRYVYVEALDGDFFDPHLLSEDRKAIVDVQNALRDWNRYVITLKRHEAELLFVVRKGRIASVEGSVGGNVGSSPGDERTPTQPKTQGGVRAGVGAEVGSPDDLFYVYLVDPDGSVQGPIWKHYKKDGLNIPEMPLFKQFKESVEAALKAPAPKAPTP